MHSKIIVYSLPNCALCNELKHFLLRKGFHYENINVSSDAKAQQDMVEKSGQYSVPVIDIDGQVIAGYPKSEIENLLKK